MKVQTATTRRQILRSASGALTATALWPRALQAQAAPQVVVIGGGYAGASCARALKAANNKIDVTLVEARGIYTSPPMSNAVLGGLRDLQSLQFRYAQIAATGVTVKIAVATRVDAQAKTVALSTGDKLSYDRLVLAPGIALRFDSLTGYTEQAVAQVPHAWTANVSQLDLLRKQLEAMDDGGVVAIVAPDNPSRCPPGPYERASMIANYLKARKPRSKIIILDAKDTFTMQQLFMNAWKQIYPGMIDWKSPSNGGNAASIDIAKKTIETDFDNYQYAVANVIPAQKAGAIATIAGVADRSGWCPVDPVTFESSQQKNIHVIGDAAFAGSMPKSAFSGAIEGKQCASAIAQMLDGKTPAGSNLGSNCYSLVAPDYAISISGNFAPVNGEFTEVDNSIHSSPIDALASRRAQEAKDADAWFRTITSETFG
jgi:sulfide dehydrogenase [flavocytochrome c] flavoprotein subunit